MESSCKLIESLEPILTPGYKLDPGFIDMIQKLSFSGEGNANPHLHLRELERIYDLFSIEGMSDKTIQWKLFLFSLMGKAKQWYHKTVGSVQGDWGTLRSEFFFKFFPISRIARLQRDILNFKQHDEEPFVIA
jgi:hypothetical protein